MHPLTRTLATLALALVGVAAHAAANLVANGSFEQGAGGIGSFAGWTATLGDATTFVDSTGQTGPHWGQASDGLWSAFFGSTLDDGGATISQTLATTAGQRYLLSFDVANDNGGLDASNALRVSVGGAPVFGASDLGDQDYAHETLSFVATGASTTLSFFAFNDASYVQLDNISATAAAVPEPNGAVLALAGLLSATLSLRLRRRDKR